MSNGEFIAWGIYFGRKAQRAELAQKQAAARAKVKGKGGR